jgi:hypothetical protein
LFSLKSMHFWKAAKRFFFCFFFAYLDVLKQQYSKGGRLTQKKRI